MKVYGNVKAGLGEGKYWIGKTKKFFKEKYNIDLVLGTLNLELENEIILETNEKMKPEKYGGEFDVMIVPCDILGEKAYIVRPEKNNNANGDHSLKIIEIVSNVYFREKYNLKDGDRIEIQL